MININLQDKLKMLGYDKELALIQEGKCPSCKKQVDTLSFSSQFYYKEFLICGYCESCTKRVMECVKELVQANICARCKKPINGTFSNDKAMEAYFKFGVCEVCQEKVLQKVGFKTFTKE